MCPPRTYVDTIICLYEISIRSGQNPDQIYAATIPYLIFIYLLLFVVQTFCYRSYGNDYSFSETKLMGLILEPDGCTCCQKCLLYWRNILYLNFCTSHRAPSMLFLLSFKFVIQLYIYTHTQKNSYFFRIFVKFHRMGFLFNPSNCLSLVIGGYCQHY